MPDDENISREEAIAQGIVTEEQFDTMAAYARALFKRGSEMAAEKGLILVDTKYEFGLREGKVITIDEIHTPDSSRYFYAEGYEERLARANPASALKGICARMAYGQRIHGQGRPAGA